MNLSKKRSPGIPRPFNTYRGWRRNASDLSVEGKDWFGVSAKPSSKKYPDLVLQTSRRGETHYIESPF